MLLPLFLSNQKATNGWMDYKSSNDINGGSGRGESASWAQMRNVMNSGSNGTFKDDKRSPLLMDRTRAPAAPIYNPATITSLHTYATGHPKATVSLCQALSLSLCRSLTPPHHFAGLLPSGYHDNSSTAPFMDYSGSHTISLSPSVCAERCSLQICRGLLPCTLQPKKAV